MNFNASKEIKINYLCFFRCRFGANSRLKYGRGEGLGCIEAATHYNVGL